MGTWTYFLSCHEKIFRLRPADYADWSEAMKEMIGAGNTHKQNTFTHHHSLSIGIVILHIIFSYSVLFILTLWMLSDVFCRRQLLSLLDGGDSRSSVPMAIGLQEVTLHLSSLTQDLTVTGGELGFGNALTLCSIISMWSAWRNFPLTRHTILTEGGGGFCFVLFPFARKLIKLLNTRACLFFGPFFCLGKNVAPF